MHNAIDTKALIERCDIHALKADDAGLYTTANTLWLAARRLEELSVPAPAPAPDACYADCISPDVPDGHDTILGYLAKRHADVLDLIDPNAPGDTVRDGWRLANECKRRGLEPVYVDAPPVLARQGIFTVRAYPLDLLQQRWGV